LTSLLSPSFFLALFVSADTGPVDTLVTPHVRIKDLDISRCKLQADALDSIWYALGYQGHCMVTLDVSQNVGHVDPGTVSRALEQFTGLRRLGMSNMGARPSNNTGHLTFEALWQWPLEDLNLSGVALDAPALDALCRYLESPVSHGLCSLSLEKSGLCGNELARLFRSMGQAREMVVYANAGSDEKRDGAFADLPAAIAENYGPTALYLDRWEFGNEQNYILLMQAMAATTAIRLFSAAGTLIPGRELSAEGGRAVEQFLAMNHSIRYLDLSGYDCKLEDSRLGRRFAAAMRGLAHNHTLLHLRVKGQMLGRDVMGLATALGTNTTLRSLDMPGSGFRLSEFAFLGKEMQGNRSLRAVTLFVDDAEKEATMATSWGPVPVLQRSMSRRRLWPGGLVKSATQDDIVATKLYEERKAELVKEWRVSGDRIWRCIERNRQEAEERMTLDTQYSHGEAEADVFDASYLSEVFGGLAAQARADLLNGTPRTSQDIESGVGHAETQTATATQKGKAKEVEPIWEETCGASRDPLLSFQRYHDETLGPSSVGGPAVPTTPELDHMYGDTTADEYSPYDARTPAEGFLNESERTKSLDLLKHEFWTGSWESLKGAQSVAA
jgi:hypothetical protein